MPTPALSTGPPNSSNERQPLLNPRTVHALAGVRSDLEAVAWAEPEDNKRTWRSLWYLILKLLTIVVIITVANHKEEDVGPNDTPLDHSASHILPQFDFKWALWRALGGGLSGAAAMIVQALALMPLRTTLNYQHLHHTTTTKAIKTLHNNRSYARYYRGLPLALIYRTLARFGDTAANVGVLALLGSNFSTKQTPSPIKTVLASLCATAFRFILAPIDTVTTTLQTEGLKPGLKSLRRKIKDRGITCLWSGALTGATVSFVEHYFWFATYNYLKEVLPKQYSWELVLSRQAFIGLCAGLISYAMLFPVVALRMMYLLFHERDSRSVKGVREIVVADGPLVLFGRGWQVKIVERGFQGVAFAVLWKLFMDLWDM